MTAGKHFFTIPKEKVSAVLGRIAFERLPEPIPERPVGYFRRRPGAYADANRANANYRPLR